jgi:hypothetical protein
MFVRRMPAFGDWESMVRSSMTADSDLRNSRTRNALTSTRTEGQGGETA